VFPHARKKTNIMPAPTKIPFANIRKPSDKNILAASRGTPFKSCPNCGRQIISSEKFCGECARLRELGFGPAPRAPHPTVPDTQQPQSYRNDSHSGYHDTISDRHLNPNRERQ
jgi:hypothetical protein